MNSYKFDFVNYLKGILEKCVVYEGEYTPPETYLKFYHNFKSLENIQADSHVFPCVYLDEPFRINYIKKQSGALFHKYTFTLVFMDESNLEETADDYYAIALKFEDPIRQFISKLKKFSDENGYDFNVLIEGEPIGYPFINMFDVNVSGMIVDFVLTVEYNKPIC